jgi:hypothetical protein
MGLNSSMPPPNTPFFCWALIFRKANVSSESPDGETSG